MVREMSQMRFPRYVGRDPRDFFYLLLKESIFDEPPAGAAGGEWKACGGEEGYPVPVVTAELRSGVQLYKVDLEQVSFTVETSRPDDALLAVPFGISGQGIATGLRLDREEISPLQAGAFGIAFGERGASLLEPGVDTAEPNVVQGVSPAMARMFPVRHMLGSDAEGWLYVATGDGGADELAGELDRTGSQSSMAMIPAGQAPDAPTYWLVARPSGIRAWMRIFEDTEPVPPSVWREVFRQRGHLLDHD
jgi:hypothetical protein